MISGPHSVVYKCRWIDERVGILEVTSNVSTRYGEFLFNFTKMNVKLSVGFSYTLRSVRIGANGLLEQLYSEDNELNDDSGAWIQLGDEVFNEAVMTHYRK